MLQFLAQILSAMRRVSWRRSRGWLLAATVLLLLVYGTLGFAYFEAEGPLEGMSTVERLETSAWWAIVSMTTVGYGDVFPETWQGRWLVAAPLLIFGIGILGYAIGVLTSAVIERHSKELRGMVPYTRSGHILICNCPSIDLVLEIARELRSDPAWRSRDLVLLTDVFEEQPEELRKADIFFVAGNPCRERSLLRAGLEGAHRVMLLTQDPSQESCDSVTLGVLVSIRSLRPDVYVVAECQHPENFKLLRSARVDEIVSAAGLRAELMVQGLQDPGVNELIEELLTNTRGHQFYVHEIAAFSGTYGALAEELRRMGNYALLGVIHGGDRRLLPPASTPIAPGYKIIVIGDARPVRL